MKKPRHQRSKEELLARMPHLAPRPKLRHEQIVALGLCHHENHDAIVNGSADTEVMWHFVESVLTWWKVAQVLGAGQAEMGAQLGVAARLVERWSRTGRVRFDGPDLQVARQGLGYMDDLAELVDWPTAIAASTWSNAEVNRLIAADQAQKTPREARAA